MSGSGIRDCLTAASLGWKICIKKNKKREFYTFDGKHVRDFIRKSIKRGLVSASTDILIQTLEKNY